MLSTRRRSLDDKEPKPSYNRDALKSLSMEDLIQLCRANSIDLGGTTTKPTIIARMLSNSDEALSEPLFTVTGSAKKSPRGASVKPSSRSASMSSPVEVVGYDSETQLKAERERLKAQWEAKIKTEGQQPWANPATLKSIFDTEMMPRLPIASSSPTVVLLVGPAASGKSSALEMVGLELTDQNTVRVDPDKIYEWLANKYGYFPPELKDIKDIKDPNKYDNESPAEYIQRCTANRAKLTKQNTDRLVWWLDNKDTFNEHYGREFEDGQKRVVRAAEFCTSKTAGVLGQYKIALTLMEEMIFKDTTSNGLNVLLDTTGGMKELFLERMAAKFIAAKYKVVIVLVVSAKNDCKARVSGTGGRNAQQHRKLDEGVVGQIWDGFVKDGTPCRWERFSRERSTEFAVVQNTWTPTNPSGIAIVIYRRNPDGRTETASPAELSQILGTYNVTTDSAGGFLCGGSDSKGRGGSSRKRRISRRRIHGSRARKTVKKYSRPMTRRRHRRH